MDAELRERRGQERAGRHWHEVGLLVLAVGALLILLGAAVISRW